MSTTGMGGGLCGWDSARGRGVGSAYAGRCWWASCHAKLPLHMGIGTTHKRTGLKNNRISLENKDQKSMTGSLGPLVLWSPGPLVLSDPLVLWSPSPSCPGLLLPYTGPLLGLLVRWPPRSSPLASLQCHKSGSPLLSCGCALPRTSFPLDKKSPLALLLPVPLLMLYIVGI